MEGRSRPECYKKKWLSATSGTYKKGRPEREGKWKLKENNQGRIIYSLDMNNGQLLNLLQTDENVVYIMDNKGGIFVGDHDFSYSLNRRK